jgi:hypothetical protein
VMVLIIDDRPASAADALAGTLKLEGLEAESVEPQDVSRALLEAADLILVDYRLNHWVKPRDEDLEMLAPEKQMLSDRPVNGLALAAVLRSQLPKDDIRGVALLSANLKELVENFSPLVTEHAAARVNGLDWAFGKDDVPEIPSLPERVVDFTQAVCTIREAWLGLDQEEDREAWLLRLLGLPCNEPWSQVAARDIHAAQAPINQLATATHGLSILRWLSQRILPYPTFLVDHNRLAVGCGVTPNALARHIGTEALDELFGNVRYRGPLASFLGPRWWRAGVRWMVREWTGSSSPEPEAAAQLSERLGDSLAPLEPSGAVLCIDGQLRRWAVPVAREHAIRVRPDDWPPFAETGWMAEELLEDHPDLRDLVDPADRARLEAGE